MLFEVWARDVPEDDLYFPEGSTKQKIGEIVSNSPIVTSNFGDTRLFFQHEFLKEDWVVNPHYKAYTDRVDHADIWGDTPIPEWPEDDREEAEQWVKASMATFKCPFAWLLGEDIDSLV